MGYCSFEIYHLEGECRTEEGGMINDELNNKQLSMTNDEVRLGCRIQTSLLNIVHSKFFI
jgi:hypothetical protein